LTDEKPRGGDPGSKAAAALSVTVLPLEYKPLPDALKNKPDAGGAGYGAGLRVALERRLAQQGGFRVVPASGEKLNVLSPREAAARLNVRLVLRGSVEFPAEGALVTALELLEPETGALVWSGEYREPASYEWPAAQFLPLEEKLAKDLTAQLPLRLLRGERPINHVAVLPYLAGPDTDAGGDKRISELNAIADLVTRNLAMTLSQDRRLKVVSPGGIVRLKGTAADDGPEAAWSEGRRTGKRLGVDAVFEVSTRVKPKPEAGPYGVWSLQVELLEVESGAVLWTETFESPIGGSNSGYPGHAWPETLPAVIAAKAPPLLAGR
jgi:TolB-like protein